MILILLTLAHAALAAVALCAGATALLKIFTGRSFERSSAIFIKVALAASVIGLLFSAGVFRASYLTAMITVYVAGVAVLAWKGFHLTRSWGLVFAISLVGVLCLNVLVVMQHLFGWLSILKAADPGTVKAMLLIAESAVALLFAAVCVFAVERYRRRPSCL